MFKKSLIIIALPLMLFATQWQSLNGPPAGRADDLTIGKHLGQYYIYAADQKHKLYKSENEGEYWDSIPDLDIINPTCVITDPNEAWTVYIGKNDATPVWKSIDGGGIWEPKSSGIANQEPLCFAIDPQYPDTVYLGCNGYPYIYVTTNGGDSWSPKPIHYQPLGQSWDITTFSDFYNNVTILATYMGNTLASGVYRSTNNGETWQHTLQQHQVNSVAFFDDQIAYAGCWNEDCSIYKSYDGGINWEPLPLSPYHVLVFDLVVVDADLIYAATSMGIYMSTNGGNSWVLQNNGIIAKCAMTLMNHPANNQVLFAGTEFSLYKTENSGSQWIEKTRGFKPLKTTGLALSSQYFWTIGRPFGPMNSALHPMQVSFSENNGDSWSATFWTLRWQTVTGWSIEACADNGQLAFVSYLAWRCDDPPPRQVSSVICRSSDLGTTWERAYTTGPNIQFPVAIHQIVSNPLIRGYVYAAFDYVPTPGDQAGFMRSNQYGVSGSWSPAIQGLGVDTVYSISINPHDGNNLYTGTASHGVYESVDNADNWTQTGLNDVDVNALAIDFDYPDTIYAGSENPYGIYKTTNGFETYPSQANNGLDYLYIADLEIDPSEPTIVYTLCKENESAEETHVYCTVDRAGKWFDVTAGLPTDKPTHDLEIDRDEPDPVYAATEQGVYTYTPDFNKSLVSSSSEATKSNASRKMLRGGIDDFWITYESGGVIYAVHSGDGGQTWSKKMEIGYGCNPGISTDPNAKTPKPGIVWRSQNHQTLYFARHISGSNWTSPTVLQTSVNGFGPPSFVIGTDNFGRVVYSEFDGQSDKIYLYKFHIYFPFPGIPALIDEGIDPSIDFMLPDGINPEIHVAWVKSNGVWYSSKFISGTSWLNKQRIIPFGVQPCIEVCGTNVYVVCKRHTTISHRWASYANGNPTWSGISVPNFSQTATHSVYPVLTGGWSCAWTEQESDSDIYFSYYDPALGWVDPINISNTTESSAHAHIVHKQTVNQTTIYFIWVEKDKAPYHIEFVSEIFGDRDKGEDYDLPFYIADGGEENASPFNLRREGYLQYGPEPYKRIDYDAQYLEYQFANLNPDREYGAGVYLYQHGSSSLAISAEVDGYQIGALNLPPDTLIILRHIIPAAFYADSMIHVKIYGNNAVSAILVLYEYEIESDRGGPQSSQSLPGQAGVLALSIVPNPAKENVGVRYTLPTATSVKLSLFDVTGRLIEHVVNENQPSGTYHKSFSNINLSQGIYFIRLESDDKALVKKVIFLK